MDAATAATTRTGMTHVVSGNSRRFSRTRSSRYDVAEKCGQLTTHCRSPASITAAENDRPARAGGDLGAEGGADAEAERAAAAARVRHAAQAERQQRRPGRR